MSVAGLKAVAGRVAGKTVMSGIQATGEFHLGNFLGAVQAWQQLSELPAREVIFMVADLHSITVAKGSEKLNKLRWEALASIIACGIDPQKCNIYFQSQVPAHAQLHWVLSSIASMGYLSRMTQWKAKSGLDSATSVNQLAHNTSQLGDVNLALFSYPVLQAADVLVNKADVVPVGEDQAQHLELARHVANSFNFRFGNTFRAPQTALTPFKRVLSLRNPTKKMSKSDTDPMGCIYITESAGSIAAKLKKAVTDSEQGPITYELDRRPAVSNLVLIASGLMDIEPQQFLDKYRPANHMQLKQLVSDVVAHYVRPMSEEFQKLIQDRSYLEEISQKGAERAKERTDAVYAEVAKKVGF